MGLIDVYRINPADQFSVYSPSLKKAQDITYYTLLAKIRGDLNITSTESNIENWNDAYNQTIVAGAVTGYETKTITLTRRDGSTVSFDFQDLNPQDEDTLDMVTTRGNVTVNSIDVGGVTTDYLQFDTAATTTLQPGRMAWNTVDGTVDLRLMGDNVTLQVGQEQVVRVVNKTGADLLEANYQAVKITGAQGNRLKIGLARGDSDPNSADTIGLVTETIANNQEGFITSSGLVRNINTTGSLQGETWADGDVIYLSPTTFGAVTNVKPIAPQHTVILGFVVRAHATQGQIYVKVDNGYEINELHNVKITTTPTNGQFLVYNSSLQVWENQTVSPGGGVSGSGTATQVAFWNTSSSLSSDSNLYWDNTNKRLGIGTSSPTYALDVVGNIRIGDLMTGYAEIMTPGGPLFIYDGAGGYLRVGNIARQDFVTGISTFRDGYSSPTLYLYNQNVGIGITSPAQKLDVDGTIRQSAVISSLLKTNASGDLVAATAGTDYQVPITDPVTGTGVATQVAFWNTSSSLSSDSGLYWDNTLKNLGIGTTSPIEKLVVSDNGAMGFEFQPSTGRFYRYDRIGMTYGSIDLEATNYTFSISSTANPSFQINSSSSQFGVSGTATPYNLDVYGDLNIGIVDYSMGPPNAYGRINLNGGVSLIESIYNPMFSFNSVAIGPFSPTKVIIGAPANSITTATVATLTIAGTTEITYGGELIVSNGGIYKGSTEIELLMIAYSIALS